MPSVFVACDEIASGTVVRVDRDGGEPIAVFNLGGAFFATDDTCTHGRASLAEGDVDGDEIVCPYHGGAFDIRTGAPTAAPCRIPLRTYPVVVEDGVVRVELPE